MTSRVILRSKPLTLPRTLTIVTDKLFSCLKISTKEEKKVLWVHWKHHAFCDKEYRDLSTDDNFDKSRLSQLDQNFRLIRPIADPI